MTEAINEDLRKLIIRIEGRVYCSGNISLFMLSVKSGAHLNLCEGYCCQYCPILLCSSRCSYTSECDMREGRQDAEARAKKYL